VTISGSEIDEFKSPDAGTWQLSRPRDEWPEETLLVSVSFEKGVAVAVDGEEMAGPEIVQLLNKRFGQYGVGRHIYTGDVTIGLKGRIVFECPGIDALLLAHQALEDCVNTRLQNQFRHQIAQRWAELVYTGFFYEPHKQDLEAYLASSQSFVTGTVTLETTGGSMHAVAVDSDYVIQDPDAVYAQRCNWSPTEAEGFIKLLGQSSTTAMRVREKA
jgi:argininosuccinate synthase